MTAINPDQDERVARLEQALRQSERSLRACFDYSLIGIVETDRDWQILRANRAYTSITGMESPAPASRSLRELAGGDAVSRAERHLAILCEQGIAQSEWSLECQDGQEILLTIGSVQTDDNRYIHFIDDITEQRKANRAIEQARLAAESADRAKGEFLANISHEIRTPLNGIIGLSQLALSSDRKRQGEYLQLIHRSGRILLQIVNDLLDYAKIEAGKIEYELEGFTLEGLLDDLAGHISHNRNGQEVEIAFIVHRDVPERLVGDRLRLWQCLNNLVDNAIKFTSRGSVTLEVTPDSREDGMWLSFSLTDTGIGMSPEVLHRVFRPFTQADASTARRFGGTGLGLVIVQELVRGMGGTLQVQSEPGKGSRFVVALPAEVELPDQAAAEFRGDALVFLQHEATRYSAIEYLEREGWRTRSAEVADGIPEASVLQYDLVVLDAGAAPEHLGLLPATAPLLVVMDAGLQADVAIRLEQRPLTEMVLTPMTLSSMRRSLGRLRPVDAAPDVAGGQALIPQEFAGVRILVAEDNMINQIVIVDQLEGAGIEVTLAATGREVLDRMHDLPEPPDAILMDVQMPELDGLEATRRLRAEGCVLPIIALSAGVSKAERDSCLEAGASDFLGKPLDTDELWGALTRWVVPRYTAPAEQPRVAGEARIIDSVRRIFIQEHGDDAPRMAGLLVIDGLDEIARMAHNIKGVADNVGGYRLTELARKIEQAAASRDMGGLDELIQALDFEFDSFKNSV